jgi:hypothetical protein
LLTLAANRVVNFKKGSVEFNSDAVYFLVNNNPVKALLNAAINLSYSSSAAFLWLAIAFFILFFNAALQATPITCV